MVLSIFTLILIPQLHTLGLHHNPLPKDTPPNTLPLHVSIRAEVIDDSFLVLEDRLSYLLNTWLSRLV